MIYGDNPRKINERQDALGLKTYSYAPQISAIVQSGNLYVYGVNNPILYTDPTGEFVITTLALVVSAGIIIFGSIGGITGEQYADAIGVTGWEKVGYVVGGTIAGGVLGGALGYFAAPLVVSATGIAGVSVTTTGITVVETLLMPKLFSDTASHIFSTDHIRNGIMNLGSNQVQIFNKIVCIAQSQAAKWTPGSNEIRTTINGINTTIRFYVKDSAIINIDAFVGFSGRVVGNLIDLIGGN